MEETRLKEHDGEGRWEATNTPGKVEFRVIDVCGDIKSVFDPNNEDEVELMEKQFKDLKKKGFRAYRVGKLGRKTTVMDKFDPEEGKIIFVPPITGG